MIIRIGEIIVSDDELFDQSDIVSSKKIFFLGKQKFIGIVCKDDVATISKLERYAFYALYVENNDAELSYAVDDETIVLINRLNGLSYIFNEENILADSEENDPELAITDIVEGHFGGHSALKIDYSPEEIKKQMIGESKKKVYILLSLLATMMIMGGYVAFSILNTKEVVVVPPPPQPLVLPAGDEIQMKRVASIKSLESIEKKLVEIDNDPIRSSHEKIASITVSKSDLTTAAAGEYPSIFTTVEYGLESNFAAQDSELKEDNIYVHKAQETITATKSDIKAIQQPVLSEECLRAGVMIDEKIIKINKREEKAIEFEIKDGDPIAILRKIETFISRCPVYIGELKIENQKMSGNLILFGADHE